MRDHRVDGDDQIDAGDQGGGRVHARSRYFPVDLAAVLDEIRRVPGRYAIVGVPCFIKAVNLLRAADPVIGERVTHLLGLFCGHMKSARFVDSFAWQLGVPGDAVRAVEYRRKDGDWGAGFFQASACNWCDDVVAETADIAFGDAWVEPYSADGRGTNVAIVRSPALRDLIAAAVTDGRLALSPVDADFIAGTQAAGLRQRREGLAYRLAWRPPAGVAIRKRVAPSRTGLPWRRRLVYRTRFAIARWSHRMAHMAQVTNRPGLYVRWAGAALALYQGLIYHRGRIGRWFDRLEGIKP